jgi:hypothetical protein
VEDDEDTFLLTGNYNNGVASIVGRYTFRQFGEECLRLSKPAAAGIPERYRPFHCRSSSSATACFGFICSNCSSTAIPSFDRPALKWIFASVT